MARRLEASTQVCRLAYKLAPTDGGCMAYHLEQVHPHQIEFTSLNKYDFYVGAVLARDKSTAVYPSDRVVFIAGKRAPTDPRYNANGSGKCVSCRCSRRF